MSLFREMENGIGGAEAQVLVNHGLDLLLLVAERAFSALTGTVFTPDIPLQRMAFDFIAGLGRAMDGLGVAAAGRLRDHSIDLLAMAAEQQAAGGRSRPTTPRPALLSRIFAYIDNHLRDAGLTLGGTAEAVGVSSRYVNMLLRSERTSFRRYILARRLDECRAALVAAAREHDAIADIALSWGFRDPSHFARTFKQRFGTTPSEIRTASLRSD